MQVSEHFSVRMMSTNPNAFVLLSNKQSIVLPIAFIFQNGSPIYYQSNCDQLNTVVPQGVQGGTPDST